MQLVIPLKFIEGDTGGFMEHSGKPFSVAILEDQSNIADQLKNIIDHEQNLSCDQVYHSAKQAIAFLSRRPADIVMIDIGLPGMESIETIYTLKQSNPHQSFCLFTVFKADGQSVQTIQRSGEAQHVSDNNALGTKAFSLTEHSRKSGSQRALIAGKLIKHFNMRSDTNKPDLPLTKREIELLSHLSRGLLYKEVALELGIKIGTVKQHLHKIYEKLKVSNKTEAINRYLNRKAILI